MIKDEFYTLSDGNEIPKLAFGTWQLEGDICYQAVLSALKCGYRHIDTARIYGNEKEVGRAIRDSGIPREELFITTKLPDYTKDYEGTFREFEESLKDLGLDYVDLYLIHAPWPWKEQGKDCSQGNIDAWRAMTELKKEGKAKSIGVSNFHPEEIENVWKATGVKPAVNQIRFFIGNTQEEVTSYCNQNDIRIMAYSPLATGELVSRPELGKMAEKYGVTIAQLSLRYIIERNAIPMPRSTNAERIIKNTELDFEIAKEDMDYLNSLYHIASTRPYRS